MVGNINFGKYRFDFSFSLIFGALHVTLERTKSNLFKIEWLPFLNRASIFVSLFSKKKIRTLFRWWDGFGFFLFSKWIQKEQPNENFECFLVTLN